jgi:hypothetical protein
MVRSLVTIRAFIFTNVENYIRGSVPRVFGSGPIILVPLGSVNLIPSILRPSDHDEWTVIKNANLSFVRLRGIQGGMKATGKIRE